MDLMLILQAAQKEKSRKSAAEREREREKLNINPFGEFGFKKNGQPRINNNSNPVLVDYCDNCREFPLMPVWR